MPGPLRPLRSDAVRARPADLPDAAIVAALRRWEIEVEQLTYAPVGFGDHHWHARSADGRRWFVTVAIPTAKPGAGDDPAPALATLRRALDSARALADGGLELVVAPVSTPAGETVVALDDDGAGAGSPAAGRYALSLFPHLDGAAGDFDSEPSAAERAATIAALARLHRQPAPPTTPAIPWATPARARIAAALAALDRPWTAGPHGEPARAAVREAEPRLRAALARHEAAAAAAAAAGHRRVVTHGEPHPGNLLTTPAGELRLVDWDTVGLAVPERDLWGVLRDDADRDRYERLTGHHPDPALIAFFALRWDLADIGDYLAQLRAPHGRDADSDAALAELLELLRRVGRR